MTILQGHYDGERIVLDEPVPAQIVVGARAKIYIEQDGVESVLDRIEKLAGPAPELPPDFSEQHEHYVKGSPRR